MAVELGRQTETAQSGRQTETVTPVGSRSIWGEVELAESYLVCSMFEEAAASASSVLKRLCDKEYTDGVVENIELNDMLESAGMVFVQSLQELGRTLEIINELMQLYNSLTAIPVHVFLAGVCFQMQEDPHGAQKILEEFLSKWRFVDERFYVLASLETNLSYMEGYDNRFVLGVDTYLQVVEAYVALLTGILRGTDLAISWVEKAALPEHTRQEYLRRLQSMYSSNATGSQSSTSDLLRDGNVTSSVSNKKQTPFEGSSKTPGKQPDGKDTAKEAILRYSAQHVPTFWWFRTLNVKFGSIKFAISNGSILLTALMLLTFYFMRRKKHSITRTKNCFLCLALHWIGLDKTGLSGTKMHQSQGDETRLINY
ncbi:protein APEM9 isoform X2 [Cynara cardunculus var. scolymus]|uniref:protein APEM9 isoform X2 n=1 Tax=Cynara cardunculus var. scolymus TaxID=59895 RepID=UPI000D62C847|nr:protein APEM9 isoform X2 [Cynara cardunculus var. scolymus]